MAPANIPTQPVTSFGLPADQLTALGFFFFFFRIWHNSEDAIVSFCLPNVVRVGLKNMNENSYYESDFGQWR